MWLPYVNHRQRHFEGPKRYCFSHQVRRRHFVRDQNLYMLRLGRRKRWRTRAIITSAHPARKMLPGSGVGVPEVNSGAERLIGAPPATELREGSEAKV